MSSQNLPAAASLHSLMTCPRSSERTSAPLPSLHWDPLSLLVSKMNKPSDLKSLVLSPSWSLSSGRALIVQHPSDIEVPKTAPSVRGGARAERDSRPPALVPQDTVSPARDTVGLYSTCHQPRPPDRFPQRCSSASRPGLYLYPGLPCPRWTVSRSLF